MKFTDVFWKNIAAKSRLVVNQGGSGSSKTISILQVLWIIARQNQGVTISCVSESMPHIKRGIERGFRKILEDDGIFHPRDFNMTDHIYRVGTSIIEFFSADDYSKVKGPRRDYLYVNEVNHIPYETFSQLAIRTARRIYVDYNPEGEFFIHTEIMPHDPDHTFIHSTHLDNPYLPEPSRQEIIKRSERDPYFRLVYLMGEIGVLQGVIFTNWEVKPLPDHAKLIGHGLDFGYVNDPSALVEVWEFGRELWLNELLYETGLVNIPITDFNGRIPPNLHDKMVGLGVRIRSEEIIADSAEKKSIDELFAKGWNIHPAVKTSIKNEIDVMKRFKLNVTPTSLNMIKELRNYKWRVDKDGTALNEPVDAFNHLIDAARYRIVRTYGSQTESSIVGIGTFNL